MRRAGLSTLLEPLRGLASVQAAVPFLLNQSGSLLYYYLLGSQGASGGIRGEGGGGGWSACIFFSVSDSCVFRKVCESPARSLLGPFVNYIGKIFLPRSRRASGLFLCLFTVFSNDTRLLWGSCRRNTVLLFISFSRAVVVETSKFNYSWRS